MTDKITHSPHLAEIQLKYKTQIPQEAMPVLTCPQDAVRYLRAIWDKDTIQFTETFCILYLNGAKHCLGWTCISRGARRAAIVDISTLVAAALLTNAHSIIVAHNHPNGSTAPSQHDIILTRQIAKALKQVALKLDDHIILTHDSWLSLLDKGHLCDD